MYSSRVIRVPDLYGECLLWKCDCRFAEEVLEVGGEEFGARSVSGCGYENGVGLSWMGSCWRHISGIYMLLLYVHAIVHGVKMTLVRMVYGDDEIIDHIEE